MKIQTWVKHKRTLITQNPVSIFQIFPKIRGLFKVFVIPANISSELLTFRQGTDFFPIGTNNFDTRARFKDSPFREIGFFKGVIKGIKN